MIMETGSLFPAWIGRDAVCSLVLQGASESAAELASRSIRTIREIRSTRGSLRTVVLAAGNRLGDDVFESRCLVCRAAVANMPARKPSLLVFDGHRGLSPEARHELLSLAGALTLQLAGTKVAIRVRLAAHDYPLDSGVFARDEVADTEEIAS